MHLLRLANLEIRVCLMTVEGKQFVRDGPRFSKKQSKQGFRQPFGQQGFGGPFGGSDRGTTSASSSPSGIPSSSFLLRLKLRYLASQSMETLVR